MKLPREFSLAEIAGLVGGRVEGPVDLMVSSIAGSPLTAAAGDLALVFDPKLAKQLSGCQASALVIPEGMDTELPSVIVKRPLLSLQKMLSAVEPRRYLPPAGIHQSAVVDPTAEVAADAAIGAGVVIGPKTRIGARTRVMAGCVIGGEVTVGEDCLFHSGCLIADYVSIGDRVILQQGASIGADGFGYVTERPSNLELRMSGIKELSSESNPHLKLPQIGTVILEDDVEIGSNATIDRATMGATVIGRGTKIDNLVMIAHNCRIGREAIIVSLSGLAGSCTVGDRAIIAGHVGVKDHIRIGRDAVVEGKAGVMKDVPDEDVVLGSPAFPVKEFMTQIAHLRRAPQLASEFKALKKRVEELEKSLAERELVR